jgi:hypothetical protein
LVKAGDDMLRARSKRESGLRIWEKVGILRDIIRRRRVRKEELTKHT